MRTLIANWKARRAAALFNRGFDYAAGQLLRGRKPEELEHEADNPFERNAFDAGMQHALRGWRILVPPRG